jgi:hypothetical protein
VVDNSQSSRIMDRYLEERLRKIDNKFGKEVLAE